MTIYLLTAIEFRPGGSSYDTMQPTSFTAFTSVSESHLIGKKSTDKIHLTFESITISINPWWRRQWFSEIKCTQDLKLSKWCTTKSSAISNLHWINMSNLHHVTPPPVVGEDEGGGRRWNLGHHFDMEGKTGVWANWDSEKGTYFRHLFDWARPGSSDKKTSASVANRSHDIKLADVPQRIYCYPTSYYALIKWIISHSKCFQPSGRAVQWHDTVQ